MKKISTKQVVIIGLLTAMQVVLSRFLSINAWNIKIGFSFVPVFIAAWALGPVQGALVAGLGDFLGAILFPIGPYFPGFTLSCALQGLIFGLLLHKEQTFPRILAAAVLNQFGVSLFLTTLWISILYSSPYGVLLVTRVVQAALLCAVEFTTVTALTRGTSVIRRQLSAAR
ncbi:MAG: folate family ECF transporter S component [Butyricicoccus sp.]|nr:folate family ECF transporter S component [Butyricicoccus sp.]